MTCFDLTYCTVLHSTAKKCIAVKGNKKTRPCDWIDDLVIECNRIVTCMASTHTVLQSSQSGHMCCELAWLAFSSSFLQFFGGAACAISGRTQSGTEKLESPPPQKGGRRRHAGR